jgi:hypothetical protein
MNGDDELKRPQTRKTPHATGAKQGTLFHVGAFDLNRTLRLDSERNGVYEKIAYRPSVYEALEALKKLQRDELEAIRTVVVYDALPLVAASQGMDQHLEELLQGAKMPEEEMRAVFLAGKIRDIYKTRSLEPPPIIMGTMVYENLMKSFLNIDGVVEWRGTDNARKFSDASDRVSSQGRRV